MDAVVKRRLTEMVKLVFLDTLPLASASIDFEVSESNKLKVDSIPFGVERVAALWLRLNAENHSIAAVFGVLVPEYDIVG